MCYYCKPRTKHHFIYCKIVDKRGRVLSIGVNSYIKTKPLQAKWAAKVHLPHKEFVHAEVDAIAKLPYQHRNKAYAIYIYRFDNQGRPALAKPCIICQTLIKTIGIKHIYYTTANNGLDMSYDRYRQYNERYYDRWCRE